MTWIRENEYLEPRFYMWRDCYVTGARPGHPPADHYGERMVNSIQAALEIYKISVLFEDA